MGITTRAGVARILEYNKSDNLISESESWNRIIVILLIIAYIFSSTLQLIIGGFLTIHTGTLGTQKYNVVDYQSPVPKLNYCLQSILINGSVLCLPILQLSHKASSSFADKFSFPKANIKYSYQYMGDLIFIYSNLDKPNSFVTVYSATNEKYTMKKYFHGPDYFLPNKVSLVDIGPYIWLYGMYICIII